MGRRVLKEKPRDSLAANAVRVYKFIPNRDGPLLDRARGTIIKIKTNGEQAIITDGDSQPRPG